jgi:hypothetical protein
MFKYVRGSKTTWNKPHRVSMRKHRIEKIRIKSQESLDNAAAGLLDSKIHKILSGSFCWVKLDGKIILLYVLYFLFPSFNPSSAFSQSILHQGCSRFQLEHPIIVWSLMMLFWFKTKSCLTSYSNWINAAQQQDKQAIWTAFTSSSLWFGFSFGFNFISIFMDRISEVKCNSNPSQAQTTNPLEHSRTASLSFFTHV